jgi:hypothetical protein
MAEAGRSSRGTFVAALLLLYGVPCALAVAMRPYAASLLVPAAGPWAGRLFGHTCGIADRLPTETLLLALGGAVAWALALGLRRRPLARLPLALWWVAWVLAALGCVVNTLE